MTAWLTLTIWICILNIWLLWFLINRKQGLNTAKQRRLLLTIRFNEGGLYCNDDFIRFIWDNFTQAPELHRRPESYWTLQHFLMKWSKAWRCGAMEVLKRAPLVTSKSIIFRSIKHTWLNLTNHIMQIFCSSEAHLNLQDFDLRRAACMSVCAHT